MSTTSSIEFSQILYSYSENSQIYPNQTSITLNRTGNIDNWSTVEVQLIGGSAQQGSDFYLSLPQSVTFAPGKTVEFFTIDIFDDGMIEGTETVNLEVISNGDPNTIIGTNNTTTLEILDNEVSYIQFSSSTFIGSESNQALPNQVGVTLTRTGNINSWAEVDLSITGGSAIEGSDFWLTSPQPVNFNPGETQKTVYFALADDWQLERTETVNLNLETFPGNLDTVIGSQGTATLEILDNEVSYIQFSSSTFIGSESNQALPNQVGVTLTRTGNINSWAEVDLSITGGSAIEGSDFWLISPQPVSFNPGETSKTVYFALADDWQLEGTETVNLNLETFPGNLDTVIGSQGTATLEILDNEVSYIQFSSSTFIGSESNQALPNQVGVTLTRTGNINSWAEVDLSITGGSAIEGSDFWLTSPQPVNFNPGETQKTVYFDINDDWQLEGTETVNLNLETFPGNLDTVIGSQGTTTLEILDNEVSYIQFSSSTFIGSESNQALPNQVGVTLTRTGNINSWAEVDLSITGGSAIEGSDFWLTSPQPVNFNPGETSKTVYFALADDWQLEGTETVNLNLETFPGNLDTVIGSQGTATLEILDNEVSYIQFSSSTFIGSESNQALPNQVGVTLTRTGNINSWAEVDLSITGGSAIEGSDFWLTSPQPVNFNPGETQKTVYFALADDWQLEGTETVNLNLETFPGNLGTVIGSQGTTTLEILDNEVSYIQFSSSTFTGSESNSSSPNQAEITLIRSGNTEYGTQVEVLFTNGTATEGIDFGGYYGVSQSVLFEPGETTKTFNIDLISDGIIEEIETINLQLNADPAKTEAKIGSQNKTTLNIRDVEPFAGEGFQAGFEEGSLTNWNSRGNRSLKTATFGVTPTEGNSQLLLTTGTGSITDTKLETFVGLNLAEFDNLINNNATEGSAIKRRLTVESGDILSFDWNFLTNQTSISLNTDFAFVSINNSLTKLADIDSQMVDSNSNFEIETGYKTFTYQFTDSGSFNVSVGVLDVGDTQINSGLLVDNFTIT
ncbi:Na-Ca exchanger/integrin-beta4 [Gloeothece citriformis PCC 7424]|uniref:Na-Ca exchanger/integrin-beta4 n=1 Tax=Gloeothece citriformis (strain PCC 7424) TaxID=65393 RepID=B7KFZ9_GLOC7|nr:Calx-beta domain-containing protein [Gloeothece citriformis]ACK69192.1 Na-Ca exchanger/integrin-beta4 [Gloeothece citriformis PCC 7424]